MSYFFDTNILVYAYSHDDAAKREVSQAHIREATTAEDFVVSAQVLAEFYATAIRRRLLAPVEARDLVSLWSEYDTVTQTPDLILRAIALHQEHSLSFWDALIVQAALDGRCDVLLTEDMQHGRRFGDLEIRNPFIETAAHESSAAYGGRRKRRAARKVPRW